MHTYVYIYMYLLIHLCIYIYIYTGIYMCACIFIVVQSPSHVWLFVTPMNCSTPGFPVLHYLPEFAHPHVCWIGDAIHPSHPLSPLLLLPSVFLSIRVFSSASAVCTRWPKYWSFSLSISPCNEYSGLISFRIDWFDLAVQGTLKSLLQHHSSKASTLQGSASFMVQLSHPYVTTS